MTAHRHPTRRVRNAWKLRDRRYARPVGLVFYAEHLGLYVGHGRDVRQYGVRVMDSDALRGWLAIHDASAARAPLLCFAHHDGRVRWTAPALRRPRRQLRAQWAAVREFVARWHEAQRPGGWRDPWTDTVHVRPAALEPGQPSAGAGTLGCRAGWIQVRDVDTDAIEALPPDTPVLLSWLHDYRECTLRDAPAGASLCVFEGPCPWSGEVLGGIDAACEVQP